MLKLLKPANPEDLFVERYDLLMSWALSLTSHNRPLAEDLVHDAFIQFTLRRAELGAIENSDAYLHRMLRNMHLSQVRRAGLIQESRFSIANFDSAEMGLRSADPREDVTIQDELRQICQYACARKETSKAGSVLILRFFHSYYPTEIARCLRSNRIAVDRWLQISRREAKAYLVDPGALKFTADNPPTSIRQLGYARTSAELLSELRQTIFDSRRGDCFTVEQLKDLYRARTTVDGAALSHIVSCPDCLDTTNRLLGLPLLGERSPDERLGRDREVPPDDSGGGEGGDAGGSGAIVKSKRRYERRLRQTIEHRPQELRIAVNGFVLGAQQISGEFSKQALTVNIDEPIGFIEVFSEQGVRLIFFDVDQPIDGNIEQKARADFDSGRTLDLRLNFRGPWPALNVSYHDPTFDAVASGVDVVETEVEDALEVQRPKSKVQRPLARVSGFWGRVRSHLPDIGHWTFDFGLLLRPATVTLLIAALLLAAFVAIRMRVPVSPLTATQLLDQAIQQEEMLASRTDQILHRIISLEERKSVPGAVATGSSSQLVARHKIEIWQSAERGITARRLYNEDGVLIAGDWRRADGVQTLYHHGSRPQLQSVPDKRPAAIRNFEDVWQLSPSAREFSSLVANSGPARVEERDNDYLLSAGSAESVDGSAPRVRTASGSDRIDTQSRSDSSSASLVKATLTLSKSDLHVTEQTLVIKQGTETREYHFLETSFERRPPSAVAPVVFEPEPELVGTDTETRRHGDTEIVSASPSLPITSSPVLATPELEVEVLRLLSQAGADLGEQITVTRTSNGLLSVQGIVDTEQRKGEILRALNSVSGNSAVRVDVKTVAEELKRQKRDRDAARGITTIESVESSSNVIPADADLRRYFAGKGLSGSQLDAEISRFANRAIAHARGALFRASALKRLTDRFSAEELRTLDPEARAKWLGMIREHARAFQIETAALRRELEPIFNVSAGPGDGIDITDDASLVRAATRLVELARSNNEAIQSAFTLSSGSSSSVAVKSPQFWRSLRSSESVAAKIAAIR